MKRTSLFFILMFAVISISEFCSAQTAIFYDKTLPTESRIATCFIESMNKNDEIPVINSSELSDSNFFNTNKFSCLIIPESSAFPVSGAASLNNFIKNGGDLVLFGGPPFANCYDFIEGKWVKGGFKKYNGKWQNEDEIRKYIAFEKFDEGRNFLTFEEESFSDWKYITRFESITSVIESADGIAGKAAHIEFKNFRIGSWNLWQKDNLKIRKDDNCVFFWAKGDENTQQIVFEIVEKDKSQWIAIIDLKTNWEKYALTKYDFKYHPTEFNHKRGKEGDYIKIDNCEKILIGISAYANASNGNHNIWIDEIKTAKVNLPVNLPAAENCSIKFFVDYVPYCLKSPIEIKSSSFGGLKQINPFIAKQVFAAEGFTVRDKSQFVPLLVTEEENFGNKTAAAGMVINYQGDYKDSIWVYFGITDEEFYKSDNSKEYFASLLKLIEGPELIKSAIEQNNKLKSLDEQFGPFNYMLGTQAFSAVYQLTDDDLLMEQAKAINEMGSNILKCELSSRAAYIYNFKQKKTPKTLLQLVSEFPTYKEILDMPFDYYLFWTYACGFEFGGGYWRDGMTEKEKQKLYKEYYDLCRFLLEKYNNSRKTFYLGHWEGDWMLLKGYRGNPTKRAIKGMTDWLNVRQKALDDAKRDIAHSNVEIYNYTEVTRVLDSIKGLDTLTNNILPFTNIDYVSYSSYESADRSEGDEAIAGRYKMTLDYLEKMLPEKDIPGKRVFIGEYGFQRNYVSSGFEQERLSRIVSCTALKWGCPFILYWQMYCNEGALSRNNFSGFWMIDNNGIKQPTYLMHYHYLQNVRNLVNYYRRTYGRNPSQDEFLEAALKQLCN